MAYRRGFEHGKHKATCDNCGWDFKSDQLARMWSGTMRCRGPGTNNCWEIRHPQDFVKGRADHQTPPWTRPSPPPSYTDDAITFTSGATATVAEDISDTATIYTAVATSGLGESVTYSIPENGDPAGRFEITAAGVLTLRAGKTLNYSDASSHVVVVKASDGKMSAQQAVTIAVTEA